MSRKESMAPKQYDLSILIPARNEEFLLKTVQDIISNKNDCTEIIVVLDGAWADPPLVSHEDLTIVYNHVAVGQRAATNQACRLSRAKYVMKLDAHCAMDKDFDIKMIELFKQEGDNVVAAPVMRNLHAFDWVCAKGHRRYQGPSGPCTECGRPTEKDVVWIAKTNPQSKSFCFDSEPHFQYFNEWKSTETYKQQEKTGYVESMSLQGSCFMLTRDKYWELDIGNEDYGSWGSQGLQISCSFWLSGGRVLINLKSWYSHMFRTQGGDFGFPYPQRQSKINEAKAKAKDKFFNNKFEKQTRPIIWLIDKFWPVKGWTEEQRELLRQGKL